MWSERSGVTNAVIVGAFVAALAGLSVLAWAVASPGPDDEPPVIEAITDDHLVYLLGPNEITVVDPQSRETVHTIATEYDPDIAIAPDGARVYLTDGSTPNETLSVIDTQTWQVLDQLPAPDRIHYTTIGTYEMAVSVDGRHVFVHKSEMVEGRFTGVGGTAPNTDHWWDIYDTAAEEFTSATPHVANCSGPVFPDLEGSSSIAIVCGQSAMLTFLDLAAGEVTGSISMIDTENACERGNLRPASAARAPDGTIVLVTGGGCVWLVDAEGMAVKETFQVELKEDWRVGFRLVALSPSGDRLVIGTGPSFPSEDHSAEAWVIDVESQSLLSTFPFEPNAGSLAVSPDGSLLYVVGYESGLVAYDIATGVEVWRMTDLNAPWVVRVAPRP